jgi:hypothetical protein
LLGRRPTTPTDQPSTRLIGWSSVSQMVDNLLLGLCIDCRDQRQQRVEAVTLYQGVGLCASCATVRKTEDRLNEIELGGPLAGQITRTV